MHRIGEIVAVSFLCHGHTFGFFGMFGEQKKYQWVYFLFSGGSASSTKGFADGNFQKAVFIDAFSAYVKYSSFSVAVERWSKGRDGFDYPMDGDSSLRKGRDVQGFLCL